MAPHTIIVGAGQAGSHAAIALRKAGYAGRITLVGEEAELPYERPPLSKALLDGTAEHPTYFHPPARYAERDIAVVCGARVTAIAPRERTATLGDGRVLDYTDLVIATGSRPRRIEAPGAERILYLRTLDDARLLRGQLTPGSHLVCIGAGVIGLEIASSARARGCAVTVIEAGPRPMARSLGPEVADWLTGLHRRHGVRFLFDTVVAEVRPDGVVTAAGDFVAADGVVAGVGIARNAELAAAAGIAVDDGILVDAFGRTDTAGVYAAGEVAAFWSQRHGRHLRLESWQHAQDHGIAVGQTIAGRPEPYECIPWFWSDQHGINLQVVGTPAATASTVVRGILGEDAPFSVWAADADDRLTGVVGIDAPKDIRAGKMLMRSGGAVDRALIADTSLSLQALVKRGAAPSEPSGR